MFDSDHIFRYLWTTWVKYGLELLKFCNEARRCLHHYGCEEIILFSVPYGCCDAHSCSLRLTNLLHRIVHFRKEIDVYQENKFKQQLLFQGQFIIAILHICCAYR